MSRDSDEEGPFPAEIYTKPKSANVEEGQKIRLVLQADGNPPPDVVWMRNNNPIAPCPRFKFDQPDDDTYVFEIHPALPEDEGRYMCVAENDLGADKYSVNVTVRASSTPEKQDFRKILKKGSVGSVSEYDAAGYKGEQVDFRGTLRRKVHTRQRPQISSRPRDTVAVIGKTAVFNAKVSANPEPTIKWFHFDTELRESDTVFIRFDGENASLTLNKVYTSNSGEYTIVATNEAGEARESCDLRVEMTDRARGHNNHDDHQPIRASLSSDGEQVDFRNSLRRSGHSIELNGDIVGDRTSSGEQVDFRNVLSRKVITKCLPVFVTRPRDLIAHLSEDAVFYCRIQGHPEPDVTWWKDGTKVEPSKRIRLEGGTEYFRLRLSGVEATDAGVYEVRAENVVGEQHMFAELKILGVDSEDISELKDDSVLHLERDHRKDGEQVDFRGKLQRHVQTKQRPHFTLNLRQTFARAGHRVCLAVKVVGTPTPTVKWYHNGEPVGLDLQTSFDGRNARLVIPCLTARWAGEYSCKATNEAGEVSETCDVILDNEAEPPVAPKPSRSKRASMPASFPSSSSSSGPVLGNRMVDSEQIDFRHQLKRKVKTKRRPRVLETLEDQHSAYGTPARFRCKLEGEPAPKITWLYDHTELKSSSFYRMSFDEETGNAELCITEVYPEDQGEYMIHAKNEAGETTDKCELRVSDEGPDRSVPVEPVPDHSDPVGAKIDCVADDTTVLRGTSNVLRALFSGVPKPNVSWTHNGRSLQNTQDLETKVIRDSALLVIHKAHADMSGTYAITVANKISHDSKSFKLSVEDKPSPPAGRPEILSASAKSITVAWQPCSSDVIQYKVEVNEESDYNWKVLTANCRDIAFEVRDLTAGRSYRFRISAENKHGCGEPGQMSEFCIAADRDPATVRRAKEEEPEEVETRPHREEPPPVRPKSEPPAVLKKPKKKVAVPVPQKNEVYLRRDKCAVDVYKLKELLTKGRFSSLYSCEEKSSGRAFVAKLLRINECSEVDIKREVSVLNELTYVRIVDISAAFIDSSSATLILESLNGGHLLERLCQEGYTLTYGDSIEIVRGIAMALRYMHDKKFAHLNLKPENVMFAAEEGNLVKLVGFGSCRNLEQDGAISLRLAVDEYVGPELRQKEPKISYNTDIWSLGVIAYLLLVGDSPLEKSRKDRGAQNGDSRREIRFKWDADSSLLGTVPEDAELFVRTLLNISPERRLNASACLQHTWLSGDPSESTETAADVNLLRKYTARRRRELERQGMKETTEADRRA